MVDGVVHYCVANMPGAVARTSTFALNNVTWPRWPWRTKGGGALKDDPYLRDGLNIHDGKIVCKPVADARHLPYTPVEETLA